MSEAVDAADVTSRQAGRQNREAMPGRAQTELQCKATHVEVPARPHERGELASPARRGMAERTRRSPLENVPGPRERLAGVRVDWRGEGVEVLLEWKVGWGSRCVASDATAEDMAVDGLGSLVLGVQVRRVDAIGEDTVTADQ